MLRLEIDPPANDERDDDVHAAPDGQTRDALLQSLEALNTMPCGVEGLLLHRAHDIEMHIRDAVFWEDRARAWEEDTHPAMAARCRRTADKRQNWAVADARYAAQLARRLPRSAR